MTALCDFAYIAAESGYVATCAACGRTVRTRTTKAVANCRASSTRMTPDELMQAAGVPQAKPVIVGGPGTELKAILQDWLGITADAGCGCNQMAARMDALGPDWCETPAGMDEILAVMQSEHSKRWQDGRTRLPWADAAARQLVRLACRRSRNKARR